MVVLVGDEILRLGLTALLTSLSVVRQVRDCVTWDDTEQIIRAGEADVVLLHESDDEWQRAVEGGGFRPAATLMLLHDYRASDQLFQHPHTPDGFVVQGNLTAETLTTALQRVTAGEVAMPSLLARDLMQRVGASTPHQRRHRAALTPRENETLVLLAQGLSNKQIARRLQISSHGAKRIVASLLMKLDAPNRTMAVVTAINSGLIQQGVRTSQK
ncbi:response regulator transcription factor [Streptomyces sp. NPDC020731]|uniref:response regulator transcription factor n=1 Tax=Streptomyces sp. NPDC020731 TaxID=3365085 RepID=UPI00379D5562